MTVTMPCMPATASPSSPLDALPPDPLVAYALGMLRKLQQVSSTPASESFVATVAVRLQESSAVTAALVAVLESATDVVDVERALGLELGLGATVDQCALHVSASPRSNLGLKPSTENNLASENIPESLACVICCEELMLQPASLPCGHSFCRRCLDVWLTSCSSCPTCRQPAASSGATTRVPAVNVALQDVISRYFPKELHEMEQRDHEERRQQLRVIVQRAIASGMSIREILRQEEHQFHLRAGGHDPDAEVRELLDSDTDLQEQVLAAENREQMRKERALREASRRRHMMAYCHGLPASVVAQRITTTPMPYPNVSVRPTTTSRRHVMNDPAHQKRRSGVSSLLHSLLGK